MMSALRNLNDSLAVLRVDHSVLDLPDVIISDRNAAADAVIFRPAAEGVSALDADEVYARWWNSSIAAKQKRCAEALVPDLVPPQYIVGAYVRTEGVRQILASSCPAGFAIVVDSTFYF